MNDKEFNHEGIGGLDFDPGCKEVTFGEKILKNFKESEIKKLNLIEIVTIPGRSFGHSLWRFTVHFKDEFKETKGFVIDLYNKTKLGQEGAVRIIWLK